MNFTPKSISLFMSLIFLLYGSFVFSVEQGQLEDGDILVNEGDNIQSAFDNAAENSTLIFNVGTYTLNLIVNKQVHLKGISTANVILKSDSLSPTVSVIGVNNVFIENLTFSDAEVGISSEISTATIRNNIFSVGSAGTAIKTDANSSLTIKNNAFHKITTAVDAESEQEITIKNNLFSKLTNVNFLFVNVFNLGVTYNCFDQLVSGYTDSGSNKVQVADLRLANLEAEDFHLTENSVCKGSGIDDSGFSIDMGPYGGEQADLYAFPVSVTDVVKGVVDGSVDVFWEENKDYRVDGYKIYYSHESLQNYEFDTDRSNLNVLDASVDKTTILIDDLEAGQSAAQMPTAPVLTSVLPVSSGKLSVKWLKVSGVNNYTLYYQISGSSPIPVDVGDVDSYTLTGLTNGISYTVWLTATNQYKFYIQVVAYIDDEGTITEGLFVNPDSVYSDSTKDIESDISLSKTAIPEAVSPYPALPNEGCFIATAAFGYYSHSQVQILRDFRDDYLLTNDYGAAFVDWYYHYGPYAAEFINEYEIFKPLVRVALYPLITIAQISKISVIAFYFILLCYLLVLIGLVQLIRLLLSQRGCSNFKRQKIC